MKRSNGWMVAAVVLAALSGGGAAVAQNAAEVPVAAADVVTRTYNVSDLVRTAADYPFESGVMPVSNVNVQNLGGNPNPNGLFGGGGEGKEFKGKAKPGIDIDELRNTILATIDPTTWRSAATEGQPQAVGSVQPLGALLIVTQSQTNQKRVQELLDSIRKEYGPLKTVSVRVWWVTAEEGAKVDEAAVAKLAPASIWASARTTCFSGQTVSLAAGRGRTVVMKAAPVVGTNAAMYEAQAQLVQSGAVLQVTPQLTPDGKGATLDLVSIASEWGPLEAPAEFTGSSNATAATRPASAKIDRMNVGLQEIRTTVRMPIGRPVVVAGTTREPGAGDAKQLVLVAEVAVVGE